MRAAVLLIVAALVVACVSTHGPAYEQRANAPELAASRVTLRLIDARPDVATEEVKVSGLSLPTQEQELALPLDPALEGILQETLTRHLVAGTRALRVEVTVREARAGWEASMMSEDEHARARLDVAVWDEQGNRLLAAGTGESWARRSSLDTSASAVKRIFDQVIRDALYRFLSGPDCAVLRSASAD